jgi:hypothetical protein
LFATYVVENIGEIKPFPLYLISISGVEVWWPWRGYKTFRNNLFFTFRREFGLEKERFWRYWHLSEMPVQSSHRIDVTVDVTRDADRSQAASTKRDVDAGNDWTGFNATKLLRCQIV